MSETNIWIILAAILGLLVVTLVVTLGLFCWKRSQRRLRFPLRSVTPLDDAEFESWRRPSQYTRRPEKYSPVPSRPALSYSARTPSMLEKDFGHYEIPRTPSPEELIRDPSISIRRPEQARRKSSTVSSLADRPPTPYSPTSPVGDLPPSPRRGSHTSRQSHGPQHYHYSSMSDATAFGDFNFNIEFDSPSRDPVRPSTHSDRPLNLSYARYGESV